MRTSEEWKLRWFNQALKKFPLRVQQDILSIKEPPVLPDIIESSYIFGDTGFGKTIFSAYMMLKEMEAVYLEADTSTIKNCVFVKTLELFHEIKCSFDKDTRTKTENAILDYYGSAHLLVLDDFGMERPTDWVLQTLYLIVDRRYENLKKTIFTSNLSLAEIAKIYGDNRLTSRIDRMCLRIEKKPYHD